MIERTGEFKTRATVQHQLSTGRTVHLYSMPPVEGAMAAKAIARAMGVKLKDLRDTEALQAGLLDDNEDVERVILFGALLNNLQFRAIVDDPDYTFETPIPSKRFRFSDQEWLEYAHTVMAEMEDRGAHEIYPQEDRVAVIQRAQKRATAEVETEKNA